MTTKTKSSGYPRQRCEHVVLNPLPHVEYVIPLAGRGQTNRTMCSRQTGMANISSAHRNARKIIGANAKSGVDYTMYRDENGKYGFVPKGGAVPGMPQVEAPAVPAPVVEATPAQWRSAFTVVSAKIDPETNRYPKGVDDASLAALHALPVEAVTKTRLQFFGDPVDDGPSREDLVELRDAAQKIVARHLELALDAETLAARASALMGDS